MWNELDPKEVSGPCPGNEGLLRYRTEGEIHDHISQTEEPAPFANPNPQPCHTSSGSGGEVSIRVLLGVRMEKLS